MVKVAHDGNYRVSLLRWPEESGATINPSLPAGVAGADKAFRVVPGEAICATHGTLRIDGEDLETKALPEGDTFKKRLQR